MTLLAELLEGLSPSLALNVDKNSNNVGINAGAVQTHLSAAKITAPSSTRLMIRGGDSGKEEGKDSAIPNDYMFIIDATSYNTNMSKSDDKASVRAYFGNNNIWVDNFDISLGTLDGLGGILNGLSVSSLVPDITELLGNIAYSDVSNETWTSANPVATTASEISSTEDVASATTASEVTDYKLPATYNKATGTVANPYSGLNLQSLVNKVTVNLFNRSGYQPYLSGMNVDTGAQADTDTSLISIKIELNKYAYNDLIMFLTCTLLGLTQEVIDSSALDVNFFSEDGSNNYTRHKASGEGVTEQMTVSNIFHEIAYIDSLNGTYEEKVAKKMEVLSPYVVSLPYTIAYWLGQGYLASTIGRGTLDFLVFMFWLNQPLADIATLVAGILPPLADLSDSVPNPSLNLYIDLAPEADMYGASGREVAPGIQAIELMVNCMKAGGDQYVTRDKTSGSGYLIGHGHNRGSLLNTGEYVMTINPTNLMSDDFNNDKTADYVGSEGKGLASFLEADRLSSGSILTTTSGVPVDDLYIEVRDIGTKQATMYSSDGTQVGSRGTLNGEFLTDRLPTTTRVEVVDPAVSNHDVTVVWDAGAIDYTADNIAHHSFVDEGDDGKCDECGLAEISDRYGVHGTTRLAGFVYGYAMNLVVAKIPVYITNRQTVRSVKAYDSETGASSDIVLKMDVEGAASAASLPDLVYIRFRSGGGVFGTTLTNADGSVAYAVRRDDSGNYQYKVTNSTTGVTTYEYHPWNTQSTDTVTYELAVYPAYKAYVTRSATDGVTAPATVTTADNVTYYVIDNSNIKMAMPMGYFSWDLGYFDYGWDGGQAAYNGTGNVPAVTVGINYQWGFAAEQYYETEVEISTAFISGEESRITYSGGRENEKLEFRSWTDFASFLGNPASTLPEALNGIVTDKFEGIDISGGSYINLRGRREGNIVSADDPIREVHWDVSALVDALNARVGEELEVQVTMFVEGFTIWRQYDEDAAGNLSLIHGMMDDVGINYNGTWVVAYDKAHHAQIVDEMGGLSGTVKVAQPVTVTVTIGAEPDFVWKTDATEAASANSYRFSDGTVIDTDGGVQRYEITTAAQLYGSMPESGVVVDGATGRTKAARFDWNGFVYDTDLDYDVARLSVETGGVRSDSEVIVTLADNDEVKSAAAALTAPADGALTDVAVSEGAVLAKRIDEAKFRAMSIDPLAYATFGDYLAAKGFDGASVTLILDDGSEVTEVTATATSWSSVFKEDATLSLAGGVWQDNVATFNGTDGKTYQAVVPIIVNARTIEDTEIVLDDFKVVSETRRFSEMVKRYVSKEESDGQIIEISYSLDSHMPTSVAIYNPFAFKDNDPFTKDTKVTEGENTPTTDVDGGEPGEVTIKITFAEGGEREYPFTLKTVAEDGKVTYITAPADASKSEDAQVINYTIGYSDDSEGESTAFRGSVEVSFRALRLNANNISSDIAVNDLDGDNVNFAPYSGMTTPGGKKLVALYETTDEKGDGKSLSELVGEGVNGSVTFYLEGMFIDKNGAVPEGYKKLENDGYKLVNGSYVPATVTVTPGEDGEESVTTSDATHFYFYLASYTLEADELTWDHSGISYNYNGGVKRTSVTIKHGEGTSAMKGTIQMPVNIVDGKIAELYFADERAEGAAAPDYSKYFEYTDVNGEIQTTDGSAYFAENWNGKQLVFDPFGGIEIDQQVTHPGEGETDIFDCYTYFPTKVGFKTADGYIVDGVSVTWSNLAGIRDTYRGGDYNVRLTVAAQGEYKAEGETEPSYAVVAQGFTARGFVHVESRVADSLQSTKDAEGNVINLPQPGLVGQDNIDPYTFDISSFREEVEKITSVSVTIGGDDGATYFFGTGGTGGKAENGEDPGEKGYKLTWSFTSMTVNYLGGKVALIAQLTGPDGSVQNYEITYLVQRKLATTLEGTKGGAGNVKGYTVGYDINNSAEFGVARPGVDKSYEIDPYNPFTRTLPTGWKIGVKVWNASLDTSGNVVFTPVSDDPDKTYDEELTESYLTATMPSNANLTIAKIQTGGAAGEASLQITGGQRIRIPVSIKKVDISDQSAPSNLHDGRVLDGSVTIGGHTVLIAWHGTVTVTYNVNQTATYKVTFVNPAATSAEEDIVKTVTAPDIPGRTVTYELTPYIGAIVDTAGRVVMVMDVDGETEIPAHQIKGTPITC